MEDILIGTGLLLVFLGVCGVFVSVREWESTGAYGRLLGLLGATMTALGMVILHLVIYG